MVNFLLAVSYIVYSSQLDSLRIVHVHSAIIYVCLELPVTKELRMGPDVADHRTLHVPRLDKPDLITKVEPT